jgi:hypothetical protein
MCKSLLENCCVITTFNCIGSIMVSCLECGNCGFELQSGQTKDLNWYLLLPR